MLFNHRSQKNGTRYNSICNKTKIMERAMSKETKKEIEDFSEIDK